MIHADTGQAGLRMVHTEKPDLVLLDLVMPDISGFDVCRILREFESNNLMPIIMLTSQDNQEDRLIGLELGADDYITKPINDRELLIRVKNTLKRIERNRGANPLTGLPGNLEIQAEINARIDRNIPFAAVYADLDNFKAFNDVYGFAKGDIAIKMTADIIVNEMKTFENKEDFVGHIGGDDFIFITHPQKAALISKNVIFQFDKRILELYSQDHVVTGYIVTVNSLGQQLKYPIMTISLALVNNQHGIFDNHIHLAEIAADLKKKAKARLGSNLVTC